MILLSPAEGRDEKAARSWEAPGSGGSFSLFSPLFAILSELERSGREASLFCYGGHFAQMDLNCIVER